MLLDFTRSRHFFNICDLCEIDCQTLQFCILLKLTKNKIKRIKSNEYAKYVDVRLVLLKIMFETDKLYF